MLRTIMIIPGNHSFGLTSISITLVNFFKKKGLRILFFKPFCEKKNIYHNIDDTSYLLKKHYAVDYIPIKNINSKMFFTEELYEKYSVKRSVKLYYQYKSNYDIIFIEGVKTFNKNNCFNNLNFKLLQHINAELIFYLSNNNIEDFLKNIFSYQKQQNQCNILNIIINNIILFSKYSFTKTQIDLQNNNIPIDFSKKISIIPCYQDLLNIFIKKIFHKLKIYNKIKKHYNIHLIYSFILYSNILLKKYSDCDNHALIIFPINIPFIQLLKRLKNILENFNVHSILFTDIYKSNLYIIQKIQQIFKITIPIFYTCLNYIEVKNVLKKYFFSIREIKKFHLNYLINIFTSFINVKNIFCILKKKKSYKKNISSILFKKNIIEKAKKIYKTILLPEGENTKIIKAVSIIAKLKIAKCILLGNPEKIQFIIKKENINFSNKIQIINPIHIQEKYINTLLFLRSHKGMTKDIAKIQINNNMILGSLMLYKNKVDGLVCGIEYSSANVLRPALQLIGIKKNLGDNSSLVSSVFFMLFDQCVLVYGDCAININPNVEQLSDIAITAADFAKKFFIQPRIAMLSYSTGESGCGETVDKVRQATLLVKEKRPDLIIDGPIQYDAAVNVFTANIKAPNSILQGSANIFIFPDLNAGNITYKAVQQTANTISIGPILQGLKKPINDLSRGANIRDIIYTIAITAIQAN